MLPLREGVSPFLRFGPLPPALGARTRAGSGDETARGQEKREGEPAESEAEVLESEAEPSEPQVRRFEPPETIGPETIGDMPDGAGDSSRDEPLERCHAAPLRISAVARQYASSSAIASAMSSTWGRMAFSRLGA